SVAGASPRPFEAFGAVHQTWIDLSQPKGRLVLPDDADGKQRRTKKMRGSKTGCAMRLYTPDSPKRIVMGEGVETTLTALAWDFQPDTAYWAGGDLGNMSGRAARGEKWLHAVPDLEDRDCFLPPDWCEELVYLAENDGEESHSVEKAIRGLRRAQTLREEARAENPALRALEIGYVEPPPGGDLNDLVRESPDASPGGAG
ncbi:MAG TPA: hypothetical protein VD863_19590, partial [Bradyrhizobium sp.]|nr:hypothetical protein [Bradyrhizobium sp.]